MGAFLDKPKTDKERESGAGNGIRFGVCSMQGWRIDMEDAHVALTSLPAPFDNWSFFGVFDGHAGGKVSKFAAENLLSYVMMTSEFGQLREETVPAEQKRNLIKAGLIRGFLNMDEFMRNLPDVVSGEDRSGSTAICALVGPDAIYLANCGDSRGLLVSNELVSVATLDHKPVNPAEKERIQNAGGSVMIQRVNGSLAVSRALGDFDYKRVPGFGPFEQLISCEPEISEWVRTVSDEFVVLACDGVWDVMSNSEICQFIRYQLTVTDHLESICEAIVDNCLNKGSRDNISVVLIALPGAPRVSEEAKKAEEELDRQITSTMKDILKQREGEADVEFDVTTLSQQINHSLSVSGVTFPPGGGINAKRHVIERVWSELHPTVELRQEPGRPSSAAVMGFFRSKQVPSGGIGSGEDSALSPDSIDKQLVEEEEEEAPASPLSKSPEDDQSSSPPADLTPTCPVAGLVDAHQTPSSV